MLRKFLKYLTEADYDFSKNGQKKPRYVHVQYWAETPHGSRTGFWRTISDLELQYAMTETAVASYLRKLHPGTEISIRDINFT